MAAEDGRQPSRQPERQRHHLGLFEGVSDGDGAALAASLAAGTGGAIEEIRGEGAAPQAHLGRHPGRGAPQLRAMRRPAVDQQLARGGLEPTEKQTQQARFAGAGGADDGGVAAGCEPQVEAGEQHAAALTDAKAVELDLDPSRGPPPRPRLGG
jgi:hypothetical protein